LSKKHYVVAYYLSVNKSTDIAVTQDGWSAPLTSFPTVPGSLLVFREDMIHRGVKNEASEDRLVMFMVMGPPDVEHTDEYQHFEWTEIEDEQGSQSKAYYEALERNSQYKPLRHIANKAEKRKVERELRARKYARTAKKQ
jgi:hypothetical protein